MVMIDAAGRLSKVNVVETSDKLFVEPSVQAVKRSTFLPARRNGQPVTSAAILPVRFSLREDRSEP
jgi:protein TonB